MRDLLHNRYLLYIVFIIALSDFLYLGSIGDITSVFVFVLICVLVTFFNKNMIIILSTTLLITNVLKYSGINQQIVLEGFSDEEKNEDTEDKNKTIEDDEIDEDDE